MFKRFILLPLSLLALGFAPAQAKFTVATTFTIIQDIAQNVAGEAATVYSITKPGAEIHEYQPTPKEVAQAQSADLILWNGLNLERWFEKFFPKNNKVPTIIVSEGVMPLSIVEGEYQGKPNPHAWMSTSNALIYIENIKNALIKYDPQNAETYQKNAALYAAKIQALDNELRQQFAQIPSDQRWLVTSEGAFSYLAKDYGLRELYLWAVNAEQQGTPKQVKKVIDQVKKHHIPVVFSESTISPKPMQQVAKETGARYGGVLYVDSLSAKNGAVPTYIDLLKNTTSTIINGFEK